MPGKQHYDIAVIGGGQGGIPLAWALAGKGMSVVLLERSHLGGSCVNFGCTPTKAALASARVAQLARRAREFGLDIPTVRVDFGAVIQRAREIAEESRHGLEKSLENSDNPKLIYGHARLAGREAQGFRIQAGQSESFTAGQVVLNTGTRTAVPSIPGLDQIKFLDAGNWLRRSTLPERLAIIGAGYIGMEMCQFYCRMGSEVSVWDSSSRVVEHEDEEISSALQGFLEKEGVEFHLGRKIESAKMLGAVTDVFVAAGRKPNTSDLGLESVGVECDEHGWVKVDERLATNIRGIWVAGDIRGGPMFTHTSWDDYRILESQMAGDGSRTTRRIVPYAIFTDPEVGRVGITEAQAQKQGLDFQVKRFELKRNGKARELGEPEGFIKVLIDKGTEHILGAALLCTEASELVHLYVTLMNARAPFTVIRDSVHIHPTLAEAVQSALK